MKQLIVLIGPHGVGKTTVGRLLAGALRWDFSEEIGEKLRRRALARDRSQHAMAEQSSFDEEVICAELERDATAPTLRVVETWHIGNLAYARLRSPQVADRYEEQVRSSVLRAGSVWVQPLRAGRSTLTIRQSEPGPSGLLDFFESVAIEAEKIASALGLRMLPILNTDAVPPEELARKILNEMQSRISQKPATDIPEERKS